MNNMQAMDQNRCISAIEKAIQNASHTGAPDYDLYQPTSVIILFVFNKEIELLFIQKADIKGYPWANQMAFPGGHRDKNDFCAQDTALRELVEELEITQENVKVIGSLGHFQTINSKDIEAFAGIWNQKGVIRHDTDEISRVFQIPLQYLIDIHTKKDFHMHKPNIMQLTYPYQDIVIWGVTAKILYHLIDSLLQNSELF
jgi:peroxisomal coenzyme A diphosphatase NUDT7